MWHACKVCRRGADVHPAYCDHPVCLLEKVTHSDSPMCCPGCWCGSYEKAHPASLLPAPVGAEPYAAGAYTTIRAGVLFDASTGAIAQVSSGGYRYGRGGYPYRRVGQRVDEPAVWLKRHGLAADWDGLLLPTQAGMDQLAAGGG